MAYEAAASIPEMQEVWVRSQVIGGKGLSVRSLRMKGIGCPRRVFAGVRDRGEGLRSEFVPVGKHGRGLSDGAFSDVV